MGVILFVLVSGRLPFNGANEKEIMRAIVYERAYLPETLKKFLSPEFKDLLKKMLIKRMGLRIKMD